MFTGLVQRVGTVVDRERLGDGGLSFRVRAPGFGGGLEEGESVAVDGVCQTVVERSPDVFGFQAIRTTLSRTTLADFGTGRRVNLERSLRAGDRLGGHLVQGHVDGVGEVAAVEPAGETVLVRIALPDAVAPLVVPLGSIAVDGVSLTVNRLDGDVAEVAIIPYTWSHTALDRLESGARVNLEADLVARYLRKLAAPYLSGGGGASE